MASTHAIEIQPIGDYVELCQLLKLAGVADSGGHGKQIVAAGEVHVDGAVELRKTAKIRSGQRVECRGITINVGAAVPRPTGVAARAPPANVSVANSARAKSPMAPGHPAREGIEHLIGRISKIAK